MIDDAGAADMDTRCPMNRCPAQDPRIVKLHIKIVKNLFYQSPNGSAKTLYGPAKTSSAWGTHSSQKLPDGIPSSSTSSRTGTDLQQHSHMIPPVSDKNHLTNTIYVTQTRIIINGEGETIALPYTGRLNGEGNLSPPPHREILYRTTAEFRTEHLIQLLKLGEDILLLARLRS